MNSDGKLSFMAGYRNEEIVRSHIIYISLKKIENIGIYNILVHIYVNNNGGLDGSSDIIEVLNYSLAQDDTSIFRPNVAPIRSWWEHCQSL